MQDLVRYDADEAVEYIKDCVNSENIAIIENTGNETKEGMIEYLKTELKLSDEEISEFLDNF